MMFEILILRRPVSHQVKSRKHLQEWKSQVANEARKSWRAAGPVKDARLRLTIVHRSPEDDYADIDNIIKPIQDALVGIVFDDDSLVVDVDSHRRFLQERIDVTDLPFLLQTGVELEEECVFVRVTDSAELNQQI